MAREHEPALAQPELPLGLPAGADATLRDAYDACGLARHGVPFEVASREPRFAIGLRRVAQHMNAARKELSHG